MVLCLVECRLRVWYGQAENDLIAQATGGTGVVVGAVLASNLGLSSLDTAKVAPPAPGMLQLYSSLHASSPNSIVDVMFGCRARKNIFVCYADADSVIIIAHMVTVGATQYQGMKMQSCIHQYTIF
eukprot:1010562-Pyramimonas_sp.AAC.1